MGFAAKAGKVVSGETGSRVALQKRRAKMIMVANDAAESTVNEFAALAAKGKVPVNGALAMHEMGMAIGKSNRSVVVITDEGFAAQILAYAKQ